MKTSCLIIGGGLGMGLGLANKFASQQYNIQYITRREEVIQEVEQHLTAYGITFHGMATDISDFKALTHAINTLTGKAGLPVVVIYNAAGYGDGNALVQNPDDFITDFKVSAGGFLTTYQALFPLMAQRRSGTLLATGGGIANNPSYEYLSLGVGKTALEYIVKSIAPEAAKENVHVAIVNIYGPIRKETHFSPENIAERFWTLHQQKPGEFTTVSAFN